MGVPRIRTHGSAGDGRWVRFRQPGVGGRNVDLDRLAEVAVSNAGWAALCGLFDTDWAAVDRGEGGTPDVAADYLRDPTPRPGDAPQVWTLEIWSPIGVPMISVNREKTEHWATVNSWRGLWRQATTSAARHMGLPGAAWGDPRRAGVERVRIDAELRFAPPGRARDTANYHATTKPIVDALVGWGLIPNDTPEYLDGPHLRFGPDLAPMSQAIAGLVTLTITDLGRPQ